MQKALKFLLAANMTFAPFSAHADEEPMEFEAPSYKGKVTAANCRKQVDEVWKMVGVLERIPGSSKQFKFEVTFDIRNKMRQPKITPEPTAAEKNIILDILSNVKSMANEGFCSEGQREEKPKKPKQNPNKSGSLETVFDLNVG